MVYLEGIHLKGDNVGELHKFAREIGVSKSWFHPGTRPYYDIICPHYIDRILNRYIPFIKIKTFKHD